VDRVVVDEGPVAGAEILDPRASVGWADADVSSRDEVVLEDEGRVRILAHVQRLSERDLPAGSRPLDDLEREVRFAQSNVPRSKRTCLGEERSLGGSDAVDSARTTSA